jgi:hypothetical protein
MAVSEMKKIAGNIIQSSRSLDCPTKYKIKNVAIVVGPSFLDHFLPTYGVDNRDYYLNVEGSGNYFLQEMLVDMDGFSFPYSLEVTLEKSVG